MKDLLYFLTLGIFYLLVFSIFGSYRPKKKGNFSETKLVYYIVVVKHNT